jgi:hypothetical protein
MGWAAFWVILGGHWAIFTKTSGHPAFVQGSDFIKNPQKWVQHVSPWPLLHILRNEFGSTCFRYSSITFWLQEHHFLRIEIFLPIFVISSHTTTVTIGNIVLHFGYRDPPQRHRL